jgi:DNA replication protein DnaC
MARSRAFWHLAGRLGAEYGPSRARFSTYDVYDRRQVPVFNRLRDIQGRIAEYVEECRQLHLFGATGTGKDHLTAAVLYAAAAQGISCDWIDAKDLFGLFRKMCGPGQSEEALFRDLCAFKVLAISDLILPAGDMREWSIEQLTRLLEKRARKRLPTFTTFNARSLAGAEELLTAPVVDRLLMRSDMIFCDWQSHRERSGRRQTP